MCHIVSAVPMLGARVVPVHGAGPTDLTFVAVADDPSGHQ